MCFEVISSQIDIFKRTGRTSCRRNTSFGFRISITGFSNVKCFVILVYIPYPTAFPYGNGMVLHFYQQQESSTTKTVHKVINKGLKTYV